MKRLAVMFLILLISAILSGSSRPQAPILPTVDFYVNDAAGIIFEEHGDRMMAVSKDLADKTGAQLVILTVSGITGGTAEEFAETVFAGWEIGGRQEQNGVLILVIGSPAGCVIHVGDGLAQSLGADLTQTLGEIVTTSVKTGGSSRAIWDCYRALAPRLYETGGLTPGEEMAAILASEGEDSFSPAPFIMLAVIVFAVGRSARIARRNRRMPKGPLRKRKSFIKEQFDENALPRSEEFLPSNADPELARYEEPEEIFMGDDER